MDIDLRPVEEGGANVAADATRERRATSFIMVISFISTDRKVISHDEYSYSYSCSYQRRV